MIKEAHAWKEPLSAQGIWEQISDHCTPLCLVMEWSDPHVSQDPKVARAASQHGPEQIIIASYQLVGRGKFAGKNAGCQIYSVNEILPTCLVSRQRHVWPDPALSPLRQPGRCRSLQSEWSTLIGRGMSRLVSHWSRALSHKEPTQGMQN